MTIKPKDPKDLMLAPVAGEIDINLQHLRDKSVQEIEDTLALALNFDAPAMTAGRREREDLILRLALRDVDTHGWTAAITDDGYRVHLDGGSVSIDLGLSANITAYIQDGAKV